MTQEVVIACRPVVWPTTGPYANVDPTPAYPGSATQNCPGCDVEILVGPRCQEQQELNPELRAYCFLCAIAATAGEPDDEVTVYSLGNPYLPEGPA